MTIPGNKPISIRLTADQWRWVHGVLDGQLDAGACEGGNYEVERDALANRGRGADTGCGERRRSDAGEDWDDDGA